MKDVTVDVRSEVFPGHFVPDSQKDTTAFGLQVGRAIQFEWFGDTSATSRFYSRRSNFHKLRLYASGNQSIAKYKSEMAVDGDLSFLNLDWTPIPVIPKFVDIVVNGMSERLFKPKAYAQDAMSAEKRGQFQEVVETNMISKDVFHQIERDFGVNVFDIDPKQIPESDEELSLFMQMNYKPGIEIAEETAINTLFDENRYDNVRTKCNLDLATLGIAVVRHDFDPGAGVSINYVDPDSVIHSYTEDGFFKDCFYWGEVKSIPVSDLLKIDPNLTQEDLKEASIASQAWNTQYGRATANATTMAGESVTLLYYNYKSTRNFTYKKKHLEDGTFKIIEKDGDFNPPEEMMGEGRFEKVEKRVIVWYVGIMVAGTGTVLKWELSENMVRPKSASQDAMPNYFAVAPRMYKGVVDSLVKRMIPFADLVQIVHLKIQQITARVVPDGVFIDADGLSEVDLGNGGSYSPEDALRLYFQTGSVVGRSLTQDGEFNHARIPIQQLTSSSGGDKMQMLIANYNHYLNMIRAVSGLNEATDASTPDPRALVGVQKLAALSSNTATRHILYSSLYLTKSLAEAMSLRISDVLEYSDFKDEFIMQIGKHNVGILEDIKNLYLHDFGIFIEMSPDEEQKARLEENIQVALSKGGIDLEDAIDIREMRNIKMANQLLKVRRKQKTEEAQQYEAQKQQMMAQINMQQQQASAQAAMQKIQAETGAAIQIQEATVAYDIERMTKQADLKYNLMQMEFNLQMQIETAKVDQLSKRDDNQELAKSKRISQTSSQQSKMIEQRKKDLPAINFESNEDSLDGFDFAEFEPR